jgi:tetratricopeptide (TPR) repeat protein
MRQASSRTRVFQNPAGERISRGWLLFVVIAILSLVTVTAFWGVTDNDFVSFDDPYYVTDNYHVKNGLSLNGAKWAMTSFFASNWHPLTWFSHMLDVQLFGLKPAGHHLMNLFFHVLNVLLLLWFLVYTTGRLWPSALVAAVFALHPLHVESVAWVAERKDVLSACFWLLTMLAYAFYTKKPSVRRYILALLLFALGLMAKPMLVTLPLILLLLDYWPLERESKYSSLWPFVLEKLPFAVLSVASALVTMSAQRQSLSMAGTLGGWTLLTNAVVSYGRYMGKMFWPVDLALYYPHPHQPLLLGAIVVGGLIIAVTLLVLRYRRRYPYALTGWLWYLITLVPVIGFVQVGDQSHADRYTYIPLTGLFVMVVWGAASVVERRPSLRAVFAVAAGLVLMVAALVTRQTVGYWKDNLTVFSHAVAVTQNNPKMELSLGASLSRMGRQDEAITYLEKAATSRWHDGSAFNELGMIWFDRGDKDKALGYFAQAAKYGWANVEAEYRLGGVLLEMKRYEAAVGHLRRAVQLDRYSARAQSLLAICLCETGKQDEAVAARDEAARLAPGDALVHYAGGYVLEKAGDLPAAAEEYRKSAAIAPSFMAYRNLAFVLDRLGEKQEAIENLRQALKLNPTDADAGILLERLTSDR